MPYPLSDMVAVVFDSNISFPSGDGPRIYLHGGCVRDQLCVNNTASVDCSCPAITANCIYFKPERGSWHTSCAPSPTPRYRHAAARIGQYLYVAMGRDQSDTLIASIERYDTLADTWVLAHNWSAPTSDGGVFAAGTRLYLVGGYYQDYSVSSALTMLDTQTGVFTLLPPMATARGDIVVMPFQQHVYVLGGWSADFCTARKTAERFYPGNNTWSSVADMLYGRGDMAAGVMDQFMFSIAGETKDPQCLVSVPVRNVGRYDPGQDRWFLEQSIPLDLFRFIGVSYKGSAGPVIYLFGGQGSYDPVRNIYPLKDTTIRYIPASLEATSSTTTPSSSSSSSSSLSASGLAGVLIGVIVALAVLLAAALAYIGYSRKVAYKRQIDFPMNSPAGTETATASVV